MNPPSDILNRDILNRDILIRIARVEEVLDLRWRILRAGLPREMANFAGDDLPTTHHFAGFRNDRAVACASFMQATFEDQPAWQLRGMAVDPALRSQGIGGRLLDFAIEFVRQQNHASVLWCTARVPAIRFYEQQGWTVVSEPFDIADAGPHVKMFKQIDPQVR